MVQTARTRYLLIGVLILAVGSLLWYLANPSADKPVGRGDQVTAEQMQKAIEAVAASEDAQYDRAMALWESLLEEFPGDPDLLLNQAVTVLKWIDETSGSLSSGLVSDPTEQAALRSELAAAMTKAEETIADVAKLPGNDGRTAFLQAAFLEAKSRQLQYPEDQTLRTQAAMVLVDALRKNPAQPVLACKLDDLAQELGGENEIVEQQNSDALFASWESDPRNLYLLVRTADALLKHEDPRLAKLLEPSLEIAKPMRSMLQAALGRINPDELIAKVSAAIAARDWPKTQQLRLWSNVLKGTTGFRPDTRLVKPDIMALLDVSFLDRFAEQVRKSDSLTSESQPAVEFNSRVVAPGDCAIWYDYDIDLDFDVVVTSGNELQLFATSPESGIAGKLQQSVTLPISPIGMCAIDMFDVDSPARPRLPQTVAELIAKTPETPSTKEAVPAVEPAAKSVTEPGKVNRHDTIQELVMWSDEGVIVVSSSGVEGTGDRQLIILDDVPGLTGPESVLQIEPSDIDGDGDLDLIVASKSQIRILQNNGNRTFADVSEFSQLPDSDFQIARLFACDVDRDLDQDILVVSKNQPGVFLLENILHSQFRFRKLTGESWSMLGEDAFKLPLNDIACLDLDGNASWDILGAGNGGAVAGFTRTVAPGELLAARVIEPKAINFPINRIAVADLNNDARLDLVTAGNGGLKICFGDAADFFESKLQIIAPGNASSVSVIDADGDGVLDVLSVVDLQVTVASVKSKPAGGYVSARVHGINDINGGGRINHYAVGSTLELRSGSQLQARVIRDPVTHFGLGGSDPTNLRIIFNNGLTQNVEAISRNTLVEERQELKGSCPFVYGWNGERFELITDLLWNAPLGLQVGRGQVLPDRRWEYLMLPGDLVQPRDGAYELRITEELWEVAYFDHITLTAIDHPAEVEVFTNEKVGPPMIAEPKLITAREKIFPQSAVDSHGRSVVDKLLRVDRNFVQAFEHQICQGLCEPHFIELDFGASFAELASSESEGGEKWLLYLNGWMHPTDTSLNIGIDQNPDRPSPEPPSLWVVDENGEWLCAQPFMGFPGGKPKSIVISLENVFRSKDRRMRIASSQQIYWDQAFVAHDSDPSQCIETSLPLQSAELHYRGFGQLLPRSSDQPHWYDYEVVSREPKWPELFGPFTRYGDVRELLESDDDRLVVMVSGDEFSVRFAIPDRPLPVGWKRDFILHSTGWDKDADLNTLAGDGSLPLPYRAMETYPPPAQQYEESTRVEQLNAPYMTRLKAIRN